ncbi:hypothetical protein HMPREF9530_02286, partial [Escherichia coli MS 21-1]
INRAFWMPPFPWPIKLLLSRRNPDLPLILVANGHVQGGIK